MFLLSWDLNGFNLRSQLCGRTLQNISKQQPQHYFLNDFQSQLKDIKFQESYYILPVSKNLDVEKEKNSTLRNMNLYILLSHKYDFLAICNRNNIYFFNAIMNFLLSAFY